MTFKAKNVIRLFESLNWKVVEAVYTTVIISSGKMLLVV